MTQTATTLPFYRREHIRQAVLDFLHKYVDETFREDHAAECPNCGQLVTVQCGRYVRLAMDEQFNWKADALMDELLRLGGFK